MLYRSVQQNPDPRVGGRSPTWIAPRRTTSAALRVVPYLYRPVGWQDSNPRPPDPGDRSTVPLRVTTSHTPATAGRSEKGRVVRDRIVTWCTRNGDA